MAKEAQCTGRMQSGRLTIRQRDGTWPVSNGEVIVTVRRAYATRSIQLNRSYWKFEVGFVAEYTGMTLDEVHEFYKAKFLPRVIDVFDSRGNVVAEFTIGGSTTQLDNQEFCEYCRLIREWAASEPLSIVIPEPDSSLRTT